MYSQCPDCQTRFRVTAETLRAAHGTVRCGRCGSAFDALERLSDMIPPRAPWLQPVPMIMAADIGTDTGPAAEAEYHFSAEDLERVFVDANDWQKALPSATPARTATTETAVTGDEPPIVLVDENAAIEDITLEGERIRIEVPEQEVATEIDLDATDEFEILREVPGSAYPADADEDHAEREIAALALALEEEPAPPAAPAVPTQAREPAAAVAAARPTTRVAVEEVPEPVPLAAQRWRRVPDESLPEPATGGSAWSAFAWTLGALVLAVVLAAQVIHRFRQDIVRHPQVGPPLRAAYERFGLDLLPNWDLAAFELRQWGNDIDAAAEGRMVVRASLTNRAAFAQPHPILRLELEDRFGATVGTRDFEPADYLKNPSQATRLIAPGASSEAELLLADPGTAAVGYRLDVCLRESAALLRCAGGPG
jgi:predicted Zn finger-like uncharacterized protein